MWGLDTEGWGERQRDGVRDRGGGVRHRGGGVRDRGG